MQRHNLCIALWETVSLQNQITLFISPITIFIRLQILAMLVFN